MDSLGLCVLLIITLIIYIYFIESANKYKKKLFMRIDKQFWVNYFMSTRRRNCIFVTSKNLFKKKPYKEGL